MTETVDMGTLGIVVPVRLQVALLTVLFLPAFLSKQASSSFDLADKLTDKLNTYAYGTIEGGNFSGKPSSSIFYVLQVNAQQLIIVAHGAFLGEVTWRDTRRHIFLWQSWFEN